MNQGNNCRGQGCSPGSEAGVQPTPDWVTGIPGRPQPRGGGSQTLWMAGGIGSPWPYGVGCWVAPVGRPRQAGGLGTGQRGRRTAFGLLMGGGATGSVMTKTSESTSGQAKKCDGGHRGRNAPRLGTPSALYFDENTRNCRGGM